MTKLAATLGISGTAAALLLVAFQMLPPRDGGAAQAGTAPAIPVPAVPVPTIPVRAWADPPRAATAALDGAAMRPASAETVPQQISTAPEPVPPVPPAVRQVARSGAGMSEAGEPEAGRQPHADRARRRVGAQGRRVRMALAAAPRAAGRSAPAPARAAPVRMAGPIGDILHGLGLD